jgi:hypothetical protein
LLFFFWVLNFIFLTQSMLSVRGTWLVIRLSPIKKPRLPFFFRCLLNRFCLSHSIPRGIKDFVICVEKQQLFIVIIIYLFLLAFHPSLYGIHIVCVTSRVKCQFLMWTSWIQSSLLFLSRSQFKFYGTW